MLLKTEQIKEWCGYTRRADIEKWLRDNGIPWRRGKDGEICTTLDAITDSLKGREVTREIRF